MSLKVPQEDFYSCLKIISVTKGCLVENFTKSVSPQTNLAGFANDKFSKPLQIALLSHSCRLRSTNYLYSDGGHWESQSNTVLSHNSEDEDGTWDSRGLLGLHNFSDISAASYHSIFSQTSFSHINTKTTLLLLCQYGLPLFFFLHLYTIYREKY